MGENTHYLPKKFTIFIYRFLVILQIQLVGFKHWGLQIWGKI